MKTILVLLLLAAITPLAIAGPVPISNAVLSVSTTPVGISCGGANITAIIQAIGDVLFTLNAETPTSAADSYTLLDGTFFPVPDPSRFKAIRAGSSDVKVKVTCMQG